MGVRSIRFWRERERKGIKSQVRIYRGFNCIYNVLFLGENDMKQIWQNVKVC